MEAQVGGYGWLGHLSSGWGRDAQLTGLAALL